MSNWLAISGWALACCLTLLSVHVDRRYDGIIKACTDKQAVTHNQIVQLQHMLELEAERTTFIQTDVEDLMVTDKDPRLKAIDHKLMEMTTFHWNGQYWDEPSAGK